MGPSSAYEELPGVEERAISRETRFPSVEERIKVYMSNWYVPPCDDYVDGQVSFSYHQGKKDTWPSLILKGLQDHPAMDSSTPMKVENIIDPDTLFYLDREILLDCANLTIDADSKRVSASRKRKLDKRVKFRMNMRMYCHDIADTFLVAYDHLRWERESKVMDREKVVPILLQFGDNSNSHVFGNVNIPHIKKFRSAVTNSDELDRVTSQTCYSTPRHVLSTVHNEPDKLQPIVWKLATHRHFEKLGEVYRADTPWAKKIDMAVFRGQLTGSRGNYDEHLSDHENCQNMIRCKMVFDHAKSTRVSAKLTSTRKRVAPIINGVKLIGSVVTLDKLLQYKGIIMMEGNDVASGLKWALLSQSVVLMPPPKYTSWAMEELLEPWVVSLVLYSIAVRASQIQWTLRYSNPFLSSILQHYIPLNDRATDVEEKMQWVLDNDVEAQRISYRGTMWMEDLVFHPDAAEDDRLIQEDMLKRYEAHFGSV